MKREAIAIVLLLALLLPMYGGIRRLKNVARQARKDDEGAE